MWMDIQNDLRTFLDEFSGTILDNWKQMDLSGATQRKWFQIECGGDIYSMPYAPVGVKGIFICSMKFNYTFVHF